MSDTKAESKAPKQAAYNKNDKTKDVRSTNIQAAKGLLYLIQQLRIVSERVWVQEEWTRWSKIAGAKHWLPTMEPLSYRKWMLCTQQPKW